MANALRLAALALLIIALSRPQWGSEAQRIPQEGLQVMIALDVSQSMLADDLKPNRLERARLEIMDLLARLDGDEVGLVLFSGASFIQVPLTADYHSLLSYVEGARPATISRPGTVIGEAIRTAMRGFDPRLPSQKVLIVLSDGEDSESDYLSAAREAANDNVLVYTIGFGTPEGAPVPETTANGEVLGVKRDPQGQQIISRLDEATLQAVAEAAGGSYYRASAGGGELDALLATIASLQTAESERRSERRAVERFQLFLFPALVAMIAAELIPEQRGSAVEVTNLWQRLRRRRFSGDVAQ
jgi:Ca-activated chloride channel family protein